MSLKVKGAGQPPSKEEYWAEVARLRGDQVAALMSQNTPLFTTRLYELQQLEANSEWFEVKGAPSQQNRQDLRDALAALTRAVEKILE